MYLPADTPVGTTSTKVVPPSMDRNKPLLVATTSVLAAGETIRMMFRPSRLEEPDARLQVSPSSVETYTPIPLTKPLLKSLPVPAYTIDLLAASSVTAPIESESRKSVFGAQVAPPSVLFQMPPLV